MDRNPHDTELKPPSGFALYSVPDERIRSVAWQTFHDRSWPPLSPATIFLPEYYFGMPARRLHTTSPRELHEELAATLAVNGGWSSGMRTPDETGGGFQYDPAASLFVLIANDHDVIDSRQQRLQPNEQYRSLVGNPTIQTLSKGYARQLPLDRMQIEAVGFAREEVLALNAGYASHMYSHHDTNTLCSEQCYVSTLAQVMADKVIAVVQKYARPLEKQESAPIEPTFH